jgi:hypothetical protein
MRAALVLMLALLPTLRGFHASATPRSEEWSQISVVFLGRSPSYNGCPDIPEYPFETCEDVPHGESFEIAPRFWMLATNYEWTYRGIDSLSLDIESEGLTMDDWTPCLDAAYFRDWPSSGTMRIVWPECLYPATEVMRIGLFMPASTEGRISGPHHDTSVRTCAGDIVQSCSELGEAYWGESWQRTFHFCACPPAVVPSTWSRMKSLFR